MRRMQQFICHLKAIIIFHIAIVIQQEKFNFLHVTRVYIIEKLLKSHHIIAKNFKFSFSVLLRLSKTSHSKMKLSITKNFNHKKVLIGSISMILFSIFICFIGLPKIIKFGLKKVIRNLLEFS